MARLTHPNVVTVHEVGSAGGRDFVAMELDRRRDARRLAARDAAHARARSSPRSSPPGAGSPPRMPPGSCIATSSRTTCCAAATAASSSPTSGSRAASRSRSRSRRRCDAESRAERRRRRRARSRGLTQTGSVLGTPAYMAPEQWTRRHVGPAADQFAFCVALWEALAGERPFRGDDARRAARRRSSAARRALDARSCRAGCARRCAAGSIRIRRKRWPSMDALLAAIDARRAARRASALAIVVRRDRRGAPSLSSRARTRRRGPELRAPGHRSGSCVVISAGGRVSRAPNQPLAAIALDADFRRWKAARARACAADPGAREPRLTCLDGVLTRISVVAKAIAAVKNAPRIEVGDVSDRSGRVRGAEPPRLLVGASPELRQVLTRSVQLRASRSSRSSPRRPMRSSRACRPSRVQSFGASARAVDPQDRRRAHARPRRGRPARAALRRRLADRGHRGGERLRCARFQPVADDRGHREDQACRGAGRTRHATGPAGRPLLLRRRVAERSNDLDTAMALTRDASKAYDSRGRVRAYVGNELHLLELREMRANPDDLAGIPKRIGELRDLAAKRLGANDDVVHAADSALGVYQWKIGEVAAAHAKLAASRTPLPHRESDAHHRHGRRRRPVRRSPTPPWWRLLHSRATASRSRSPTISRAAP